MISDESFKNASICLKTIANPTRLKMIHLLSQKPMCVKDLSDALDIKHNVASEHLTVMKDRGFITSSKEGREVIYIIKEKALLNILKCVESKFS